MYNSDTQLFLTYICNNRNVELGVILISRDKFFAIGMQIPGGEVHVLKPVYRVLVKTTSVEDFTLSTVG